MGNTGTQGVVIIVTRERGIKAGNTVIGTEDESTVIHVIKDGSTEIHVVGENTETDEIGNEAEIGNTVTRESEDVSTGTLVTGVESTTETLAREESEDENTVTLVREDEKWTTVARGTDTEATETETETDSDACRGSGSRKVRRARPPRTATAPTRARRGRSCPMSIEAATKQGGACAMRAGPASALTLRPSSRVRQAAPPTTRWATKRIRRSGISGCRPRGGRGIAAPRCEPRFISAFCVVVLSFSSECSVVWSDVSDLPSVDSRDKF